MSRDNTPSETAPNRADSQSTAASRLPGRAALVDVLLSLFAVEPVPYSRTLSVAQTISLI